jgi:exopolysaccharide biosynthesis predicted pyruvyltransferase EpsI
MGMLVSSFAHLSVREKQAANIISDLWYKNAEVVLDPTLLLTYDQWRTIIPTITSSKKYVLCYFLGENDNAWKHAAAISRTLNLPLVIVPIFAKDKNEGDCAYGTGPVEFFNLIDNAAFVCTDSFHGTIFSIICGKPFYVFERFHREDNRSQNSRVYHLLDITCFDNRLIRYDESLKSHYEFTCNITNAVQCLATEREVSLNFLKGALNHG